MMRKKYTLFGVLALVFALLPSVAFAFDIWPNGSYWAGVPYDEPGYYAAFVRADNRYDAAVYGLGLDPASLSAATKLKLSDPSYGGNFYKYAMTFENVSGWDDMPEWLPTYAMGFIGLGQSFERIYASKTTSALRTSALADYETVVSGGDLGGVGSGGNVNISDCVVLQCANYNTTNGSVNNSSYCTAQNATIDSSGNVVVGSGTVRYNDIVRSSYHRDSVRFYVPPSLFTRLASDYPGMQYVFSLGLPYGGSSTADFQVTVSSSITLTNDKVNSDSYKIRAHCALPYYYSFLGGLTAYCDSQGVFFVVSDSVSTSSFTSGTSGLVPHSFFSAVRDVPAAPDGEWPEPTAPVTPDPPEIPTPTPPTETVDPDPSAPTITWPTSPTLVLPSAPVVSTTPDGIDYTALLTLINDNLNSIDAYLQNFYSSFNSFRSDFLNGIDDIVDGLRNIYQYLGHLNNILEVHCKHITDQIEESVYNLELYLKRLFEWLTKQLNFDAEFDYDDSAVTTLLRRILNKIPGGSTGTPVTYKPNPQGDEPGFFDWLSDLWHRFLIDLVSVLPDELGGLVDTISQLTHYFPFSIPWDMFALLALFAHDPVTPVFDVPWGFGGGEGEIQMIRVDLSAWDGVMETVRPVFLVGFCMQLAMITKDLLANFDLKQGGV